MNKEINFKAVNFKTVFISIPLIIIAFIIVAIIVDTISFKSSVNQNYFIITLCSIVLIITHIILLKQKKDISFIFNKEELCITEKRTSSINSESIKSHIPYIEIKSYNIYSIPFLFRKIGYVLRIRTGKNYSYYLNWVSNEKDKDRFNKDDYEDLKNIFNNRIKSDKTMDVTDRLLLLIISVIPQAIILIGIPLVAILFYISVFQK